MIADFASDAKDPKLCVNTSANPGEPEPELRRSLAVLK